MGKLDDKLALKEWRAYYENLKKGHGGLNELSPLERTKKLEYLEKHPVEWVKFFFPKYAQSKFMPFHIKSYKIAFAVTANGTRCFQWST